VERGEFLKQRGKSDGKPKYVRKVVKQRGIKDLFHFTRYSNLSGIMKHGLLPVAELEARDISFDSSDPSRWDGRRDAICTSISFPNWKMFYRKRIHSERPQEWVVISLHPSVLWKHSAEYFVDNAASGGMANSDPESHRRSAAFRSLFDPAYPGDLSRESLPKHIPSNNQAEALVFGRISIRYIQYIVVGTAAILEEANRLYPQIDFRLSPLNSTGDAEEPSLFHNLGCYLNSRTESNG
jgi:hypothetical protein